jgi:hypothetical protein
VIDIPNEPMTMTEMLAVLNEDNLQEYREKRKVSDRIYDESRKYINTSPDTWPDISIHWDLSKESQLFSLDGCSDDEFSNQCPNGFVLGFVELEKFDQLLCIHNRRDVGELWGVGCKSKLAYLIQYLSEKKPISPPLVHPLENCQLAFLDGNHRYAIAKAIKVREIPIYVKPEFQRQISEIIPIRWVNV